MLATPRPPLSFEIEHQSFARSLTNEAVQSPDAFRSTEAEPADAGKFIVTFPPEREASAGPGRSDPSTNSISA